MRARTLLAALTAACANGCAINPGNFAAFQFQDSQRQVALVDVVVDARGTTTEHWAFNTRNTYDPSRGLDTIPSRAGSTFDEFKQQACVAGVAKYLRVSTTQYPLTCFNPTPPAVPTPPDAILADGAYAVTQEGHEVGVVLVQDKVEHWGVSAGTFKRAAGFSVRPRRPLTYAAWASAVCTNYSPRTYWVVTSTTGRLCR